LPAIVASEGISEYRLEYDQVCVAVPEVPADVVSVSVTVRLDRCATVPLRVVVPLVDPSGYVQLVLTPGLPDHVTIVLLSEPDSAEPFTVTLPKPLSVQPFTVLTTVK
jgi:hypothetical protein